MDRPPNPAPKSIGNNKVRTTRPAAEVNQILPAALQMIIKMVVYETDDVPRGAGD
jgi:hypothetical protein